MHICSGIPDYRSPGRPPYKPMQHKDFLANIPNRQRYWSRSLYGYPLLANADSNQTHQALARAEEQQQVKQIITQNVDGLHQKAGSLDTINLHGTIHNTICLSCGHSESRQSLQERLFMLNPKLVGTVKPKKIHEKPTASHRPDGDFVSSTDLEASFVIPSCLQCADGILKPDVVFFGGHIERSVWNHVDKTLEACDALLVVGSSLTVPSARRVVRTAMKQGAELAILNNQPTPMDDVANLCIKVSISLFMLYDIYIYQLSFGFVDLCI